MLDILIGILALLPILSSWASYKLWKWHHFYGTRFLWGLFIASLAADLASIPIAILSVRELFFPEADPIPGVSILLGISILILESVFIFLVIRWSDLDNDEYIKYDETRNQREDREFGEKRRRLESKHIDDENNLLE